jgi:hypothetical protein
LCRPASLTPAVERLVIDCLMAEIVAIAGVAITLPGLLSGIWSIVKSSYDIFDQVNFRRSQIKLLLDRCSDLVTQIAQSLPEQDKEVSPGTRQAIQHLQA